MHALMSSRSNSNDKQLMRFQEHSNLGLLSSRKRVRGNEAINVQEFRHRGVGGGGGGVSGK